MTEAEPLDPTPAEYPKMLYKGGAPYGETGRGVPHQDTRVVVDAEDEAEARGEGYDDAFQGAPHPPPADPEPQAPAEAPEDPAAMEPVPVPEVAAEPQA